jgi:hypothetical protein
VVASLALVTLAASLLASACDDSERSTPPPVPTATSASARHGASPPADARVVLVTIDGLRWQEVFDAKDSLARGGERPLMPHLTERVIRAGVGFGDRDARGGASARTSSRRPISLPGYQAIFAGRTTPCESNDCPRVTGETLPEAIARRLALSRDEVAAFGSWSRLALAVSARDDAVLVDVGPEGGPHMGGPPWPNARWDRQTLFRALPHLRSARPRFLYVGLLDTDERAHDGDREGYLAAARAADAALARLDELISQLPPAQAAATTLIVTTDHGRGNGPLWTGHSRYPTSRDIWLAARGPSVQGPARSRVSQADIRPTVERLLGLCPSPCEGEGCGEVIAELVVGLADPCASGGGADR